MSFSTSLLLPPLLNFQFITTSFQFPFTAHSWPCLPSFLYIVSPSPNANASLSAVFRRTNVIPRRRPSTWSWSSWLITERWGVATQPLFPAAGSEVTWLMTPYTLMRGRYSTTLAARFHLMCVCLLIHSTVLQRLCQHDHLTHKWDLFIMHTLNQRRKNKTFSHSAMRRISQSHFPLSLRDMNECRMTDTISEVITL